MQITSLLTKKREKPLSFSLQYFLLSETDYSVGGATGCGAGCTGNVGVTSGAVVGLSGAGCCTSTCDWGTVDLEVVYFAVNILRTMIITASVQVDFSKKSVVLRTPIIWFDDEKPAANPPPFEFCTNTMRIIRMAAIKIRMVIKIYIYLFFFIFLVEYQKFQKSNLVGKVNTFFWKIQT